MLSDLKVKMGMSAKITRSDPAPLPRNFRKTAGSVVKNKNTLLLSKYKTTQQRNNSRLQQYRVSCCKVEVRQNISCSLALKCTRKWVQSCAKDTTLVASR